ncbi:MAG: hypothetical protein DRH08_03975 [Deltaproteobacteria bacterium]|nr:MAG: hypothetical protein DRH08_03975 [Deltaproteobacteria bacterium]
MNKKVAETRFRDLVRRAEEFNARPGNDKRFFPMTDGRRGRLITIGMYDGKTKKYVLCDLLAHNIGESLDQIDQLLP